MARYIDADVLIDMLSDYYRQTPSLYHGVPQNEKVFEMRVELNGIFGDIEVIIDNAPEADVVEVVRCKDCKYRTGTKYKCSKFGNIQMNKNDFCSYGERKEGDTQ